MPKGDHLCVDTSYGPIIEHHGIDMGDGTVIHFKKYHFGALPIIAKTSRADFANGKEIRIVKHRDPFPPEKVLEIAECFLMLQKQGQLKKYNLWEFNCEHLANFCKTGDGTSSQVEMADEIKETGSNSLPLLTVLMESGILDFF